MFLYFIIVTVNKEKPWENEFSQKLFGLFLIENEKRNLDSLST